MMNKKQAFSPKTALVLSEQCHNVLIGTLLGDGSLNSLQAGRTWSYRALQSEQQKEYLFHKYSIFQDFC